MMKLINLLQATIAIMIMVVICISSSIIMVPIDGDDVVDDMEELGVLFPDTYIPPTDNITLPVNDNSNSIAKDGVSIDSSPKPIFTAHDTIMIIDDPAVKVQYNKGIIYIIRDISLK